ncbi:SulP family inorganic anion transporter [Pantanalinema rosaneae CENA516]|uniref:SulP family inorganic anion transporter n=1 Tax=Pantanalinema rosaneae TaxID=1620701 RepID=UPI003D6F205C
MARSISKQLRPSPNWGSDGSAALTNTLTMIPDALANALLMGINPVYGLHALMVGTPLGALFSGSEFMTINATGAMAVVTAGVLAEFRPEQQIPALLMLTVLVGLFQVLLGLFRADGFLRFVSNAVLTGFMNGIAVAIVLGQLGTLTGYDSDAGNRITQTLDLLLHLNQVNLVTTAIGLGAIVLILVLNRTPLRQFNLVLALLMITALTSLWQPAAVQLVKDIAPVPRSLPVPILPDFSLIPQVLLGAIAVALIGLIQGAGVGKTIPNTDGRYGKAWQDFLAQGVCNIGSGLFRGIPLGGSVSGTAINISAGAVSRWAIVLVGPMVILAVLLFGGIVEQFPLPAIAALLVVAGAQALKVEKWKDVWLTGWVPRLVMLATFIATLLLPIQHAVLLGIVLSILLYVYRSSLDVQVKQLLPTSAGQSFQEQPAPTHLPSHAITILHIYGSVFYASTDILQAALPSPATAERSVVIMGLRGRNELGSTFLNLLKRYASELGTRNSKLMLTGVAPAVIKQLTKTGVIDTILPADIFPATPVIGESLQHARAAAEAWLLKSP